MPRPAYKPPIQAIRMLEDRDGSPNRTHVYQYKAGEIYTENTEPYISQVLMEGFLASGHAVEVDDAGNPIGTPASRREIKPTGPSATKGAEDATDDTSSEATNEDEGPNSPMEQKRRRQ